MKKVLSIILAMLIITSMSLCAFAANGLVNTAGYYTWELKTDKTEVNPGDTIAISTYVYGGEDSFQINNHADTYVMFTYFVPVGLIGDSATATVSGKSTKILKGYKTKDFLLKDTTTGTYTVSEKLNVKDVYADDDEDEANPLPVEITKTKQLVTYTFTVDPNAAAGDYTIRFDANGTDINDGQIETSLNKPTLTNVTITVKGSTPAVPEVKDVTTTATGTTFGNYKDVPLFDCAATIKNASKVFIAPELFLNRVSQGTKEKVEIPGLTADETGANVVIKIAIVGADEGVVTINPNVTAE